VDVDYRDRSELVVGRCKPDSGQGEEAAKATKCYDDWLSAFTNRSLENGTANTVIMLASGKGVLELSAIKHMLEVRSENGKDAITHVLLVDPFISNDGKDEVEREFKELLLGMEIEYFNTISAYDDCFKYLKDRPDLIVAVVGGINFGYMISPHKRDRNLMNTMILLVEFSQKKLTEKTRPEDGSYEGGMLYVVTAFHNMQGEYILQDEMSVEFISRFEVLLAAFTREYENQLRNPRPPPRRR
jgi:hypothetical protein